MARTARPAPPEPLRPLVSLTSDVGHPRGYHERERSDVADLVPAWARRVLDVGCGAGALGGLLAPSRPGLEMYGVEIDARAADAARATYAQVVTGDAQTADLPFPEGFFDCLVYADVLEHFAYPGDVLRRHLGHLRPGGAVVASVPNVRCARVLRRLVLRGRWDYYAAGIADHTHLRFWTSRTFRDFLQAHGLEVVRVEQAPYSRLSKALRLASLGLLRDFLSVENRFLASKPDAGTHRRPP